MAEAKVPFNVSLYNPALLKKEDLIRGFVARQLLLERFLNDLRREVPGSAPQHHLIIGQRGLGKTTLLHRIAFAIEDDSELQTTWIPLVFPEEQYNVGSLADFWLNCVDALSDALDRFNDRAASQALDAKVERVPQAGMERSRAALNILLEESAHLNKRVLLLVDNIDIVLDRLSNDEEWEFRRVISEERSLHFIGASSRVLEALYEHGRAFYDFFQVHELKGLDETETLSTLLQLAEQSGNKDVARIVKEQPARIKALRVLTGGNPRTLMLLFRVLSQGPEGDVQHDIEQLLDQHTALYKARFEELSAQAQQIVDAMAIHWDPLTAADLTEQLGSFEVNQVSAQLKRLVDFGVVEETPWFGEKKKAFQIAERFFNIWYLMRASRRIRRRLLWLVKFLETWFDHEELSARARTFLERDPETVGRERYAEMALAYSQTVQDKYLQRSLESASLHAVLDDGVRRLIDFSDLPPELQDKKARMEQLLALRANTCNLKIAWDGIDPTEFWRLLGGSPHFSLMEKARIVEQLSSLNSTALNELYERLKNSEKRLLQRYARETKDVTQIYQALACGEMADVYDYENAIAIAKRQGLRWMPLIAIASRINTFVHREDLSEVEVTLAESVLQAMTREPTYESIASYGLGIFLCDHAQRHEESQQAFLKAIKLDPACPYYWNSLGNLYNKLEDYEQAEKCYRRAIELDPDLAYYWHNLGGLLSDHLERYKEAELIFRRSIELDPHLAHPWNGLGLLLNRMNRTEEAEQAYRRAIELDSKFVEAWHNLGTLLSTQTKRHEDAEKALRRALELSPKCDSAWDSLGDLLANSSSRYEEAEQAYRRALGIDPSVAYYWRDLGILLFIFLRKCEEAEQAYRHALQLEPKHSDSWNALGLILVELERYEEAEQAYRRAIELDAPAPYPWSNLGRLLEYKSDHLQESAECYLHAFTLDSIRTWDLDACLNICNRMAELSETISLAIAIAQKATEAAPNNQHAQFTFARIYLLAGKWQEGMDILERLAADEAIFFDENFFCTAVSKGYTEAVIDVLVRTGASDRWRPLFEALRAVRAGKPDYLNTVAPEVRTAALPILRELSPELFSEAATTKAKSKRRKQKSSRRRKSLR